MGNGFDHKEYREALIKIFEIACEGHWYVSERKLLMHLDLTKTYLWISSAIGAVIMFMIEKINLLPVSKGFAIASTAGACAGFLISMLILWGKLWDGGKSSKPLINPLNLADFVYEQLKKDEPYDTIYGGLIGTIDDANKSQETTNMKRVGALRIAAPCIIFSFIMLIVSLILRMFNV